MEENMQKEESAVENVAEKNKKIKNLISVAILLGGLFLGSLAVDAIQFVRGGGFSFGKLAQSDIFEGAGKTWVAFADPIIKVSVLNDEACENCNADDALAQLKTVFPTVLFSKVDVNSEEGKKMATDLNIKTIPAFVFAKEVKKAEFYAKAAPAFSNINEQYVLNTVQIGMPIGRYIDSPKVSTDDIQFGAQDAKVKLVLFTDFQCPYCKAVHPVIKQALEQYGDKILFVFKNLPLAIHPQAEPAALAAACANEQGKFMPFADKLFDTQDVWGKAKGTQLFKTYAAQLGLNATQFNQCLDSSKYKGLIDQTKTDANDLSIAGTPATFVNGQVLGTTAPVTIEGLQKAIDQELAK
jgi:protein-disulfide isomerase